ncbi:MAG: hypothetical protein QXL16_00590 [Candidatus Micrarchaeaceae archaeon]
MEFLKCEINVKETFLSAQPITFYASYSSGTLDIPFYGGEVRVRQAKGGILFDSNSKKGSEFVKTTFRIRDNIKEIYRKISTDKVINDAIRKYRGLRVTLNDPWIAAMLFTISQFNNVKRISLIAKRLRLRFGEEVEGIEGSIRTLPGYESILRLREMELKDIGLGFRSKYLLNVAKWFEENYYKGFERQSYETIKSELMEIKGIGEKVADCIALTGFGKLEAFPIDTWMSRAMERYYGIRKTREMHEYAKAAWKEFAGYAQQYIYHYARNNL